MSINQELKKQICNRLQQMLNEKAETARAVIESAKEARNNDTKSSAGDKYETGRAMMQIEIEKNEVLLSKIIAQQKELSGIDLSKNQIKVNFGSLIETNLGIYFIGIGIGKIIVDNIPCYAISLASPIGQVFKDKRVKDSFQFQGRAYSIKDIV